MALYSINCLLPKTSLEIWLNSSPYLMYAFKLATFNVIGLSKVICQSKVKPDLLYGVFFSHSQGHLG